LSQSKVEIILARQLAGCLSIPIFLADASGALLYYNEPAEELLGLHPFELNPANIQECVEAFIPRDADGNILEGPSMPIATALREKHPIHLQFYIRDLRGVLKFIDSTAIPLFSADGQCLGAMAVFWGIPV
jgi:PAS domain-containing protein